MYFTWGECDWDTVSYFDIPFVIEKKFTEFVIYLWKLELTFRGDQELHIIEASSNSRL